MEAVSPATLVDPLVTAFVLATMLSVGLDLRPDDVVQSVGQWRLLARSALVNLVGVPALTLIALLVAPVETEYAVGLLVIAVSPGAPFGPKLAEISDSDVAFASGLMVVLATASVLTVPASLALLVPGSVDVDLVAIARIVVVVQLVPLLAGFALRVRDRAFASRLYAPTRRLSTGLLLVLIALLVVINADAISRLVGTGVLAVSSVVVVGSMVAGYASGGPDRSMREALATSTTARNAAVALLVATTSFPSPAVFVTIVAFSLVSVAVPGIAAGAWRVRSASFDAV
ncbi:bile acid:sodium symporter family protein [Halomicrobium urmianum]|uniref:bile acid:sodium symporter family protein n=1 Tax=Halomicrobium urmianum TaxID=1586233 RepID=UPI001CD957E9|nr:bile acid:sodium symporter [Halomicrobium urmianum]